MNILDMIIRETSSNRKQALAFCILAETFIKHVKNSNNIVWTPIYEHCLRGGLYLPQVILYGIHGMNVGWDPSQFFIPWTSWIPPNSMEQIQFHGNSAGFQRNNLIWLPKIGATPGIEHWAPWGIMWLIDRAPLPLYYEGIERYKNKLNKSCNL